MRRSSSTQPGRRTVIALPALLWALLSVLPVHDAVADTGPVEFSGFAGLEARWFTDDPAYAGQLEDLQPSLEVEAALEWESEDRNQQAALVPFFRLDGEDDERTHFDIREAYWRHTRDDWEFLLGIDRVFWGVTESRHLVNVINQVDAVENIDEEDFLGQPMASVNLQKDFGVFELFVLPWFRERTFPGEEGRFRGPLVVDTDNPLYESSDEEHHVDLALRYAHTLGNWDLGLSLFHGTGREPTLLPAASGDSLVPYYSIITQGGLDLQYTGESWLWKLEAISREGQGDTFGALVGGFEYTFFRVRESDIDVGVITEYLYDGRDDTAPVTILDDDIFAGGRLSFNDVQNSSILAGFITDVADQTTSFRLEGERRLGDSWKLEAETQWFLDVDEDNPARVFDQDDLVLLRMRKYW